MAQRDVMLVEQRRILRRLAWEAVATPPRLRRNPTRFPSPGLPAATTVRSYARASAFRCTVTGLATLRNNSRLLQKMALLVEGH